MTDHPITRVPDTWINGATSPRNRQGDNYGATNLVRAESAPSTTPKRILLRPALPPLLGLTVVDAYLVGHSKGTVAQTLTVAPVTERWQVGRVKWANQPTINAAAAISRTVPAAGDGKTVVVSGLAPIIQAVADGTPWFGLRVTTDATTAQVFYALESGQPAWELHVVVSDLSEPATNPRPDGGGAVATARPRLAWDAEDQRTRRVQVDTPAAGVLPDEVAPDYDSGVEVTASREFDIAATAHAPAGAGPHFWRVLVQREGETTTPVWSDWAEFTVAAQPSLVVDSPIGALGDPAVTVTAHLSSGTLSRWKVTVTGPSRADIIATSGQQQGPISWAIPRRSNGRRTLNEGGWIHVRAWDTVTRAVAVGQSTFAEQWIPVTFADTPTLLAPSGLTVAQVGYRHPQHVWTWQRTAPAEAWLLRIDGELLVRLEPEDVVAENGTYSWTDQGQIPPGREVDLAVRAAESGKRSAPVIRRQSHEVEGVWIIPDSGAAPILLDEGDVAGWGSQEKRATYETQSGADVDIIYDANPGRMGDFEGLIGADWEREDVWQVVDRLRALRDPGNRTGQLVWPGASIHARFFDVDVTPASEYGPSNHRHVVRFEFREEEAA